MTIGVPGVSTDTLERADVTAMLLRFRCCSKPRTLLAVCDALGGTQRGRGAGRMALVERKNTVFNLGCYKIPPNQFRGCVFVKLRYAPADMAPGSSK